MSIRILPPETAAKIAAGEVITRPSSVVKELIENSLDAGSSRIDIYLEMGGKETIRVSDNGEGIVKGEVELAVLRFATSKLESADDLVRISSFGFRGEALASMAEVSEFSIETQRRDYESGILLRVVGGKIEETREIVRLPGTTVTVSNLFYNLPARKAFLRGEPYETRLVIGTVRDYALVKPQIRFDLRSPRKSLVSFNPSSKWIERIIETFPQIKKTNPVEIREDHPLLSIEIVIVPPDRNIEPSKTQKIFFNGRPVMYRNVYRAVLDGYGPIQRNLIPFFIVKLECPAELLDSNIHPAKTEVRYRDERFLFDFISQSIRKALHREAVATIGSFPQTIQQISPQSVLRPYPAKQTHPEIHFEPARHSILPPEFEGSNPIRKHSTSPLDERLTTSDSVPEHSGFWQLQNLYILAQVSSGLLIVDQHAAHERILYEEMMEQMGTRTRQRLLFPLIVDLSAEEFSTFEEIKDYLETLGFEAKHFGPNQVIIEALPLDAHMSSQDMNDLFREFNETSEVKLGNREKIAALISCKGAVKSGKRLTQTEMESLINRLFRTKTPYFCPHGRPTMIKFTMNDLDKRFGRL